MDPTLKDYMGALLSETPAELIDQESRKKLSVLGGFLPRQLVDSLFVFETELDQVEASVDFAFSVERNGPAHRSFAAGDSGCGLPAKTAPGTAWQKIREFFRLWAREDTSLPNLLSQVYMEFDLDSMDSKTRCRTCF